MRDQDGGRKEDARSQQAGGGERKQRERRTQGGAVRAGGGEVKGGRRSKKLSREEQVLRLEGDSAGFSTAELLSDAHLALSHLLIILFFTSSRSNLCSLNVPPRP